MTEESILISSKWTPEWSSTLDELKWNENENKMAAHLVAILMKTSHACQFLEGRDNAIRKNEKLYIKQLLKSMSCPYPLTCLG